METTSRITTYGGLAYLRLSVKGFNLHRVFVLLPAGAERRFRCVTNGFRKASKMAEDVEIDGSWRKQVRYKRGICARALVELFPTENAHEHRVGGKEGGSVSL